MTAPSLAERYAAGSAVNPATALPAGWDEDATPDEADFAAWAQAVADDEPDEVAL